MLVNLGTPRPLPFADYLVHTDTRGREYSEPGLFEVIEMKEEGLGLTGKCVVGCDV